MVVVVVKGTGTHAESASKEKEHKWVREAVMATSNNNNDVQKNGGRADDMTSGSRRHNSEGSDLVMAGSGAGGVSDKQ